MKANVILERTLRGPCESTVIVIDVLRATSSAVTAFAKGLKQLEVVESLEEALRMKRENPELLIAGERSGLKPDGFDLGNSPCEFTEHEVKGKKLVMTTSNGTRAIKRFLGDRVIYLAAFINYRFVAKSVIESGNGTTIVCAGTDGVPCLEDVFCAGAIVKELICAGYRIDDAARIAYATYDTYESDTESMLKKESDHGMYLERIGLGEDLVYCARMNIHDVVPFSRGQSFVLY